MTWLHVGSSLADVLLMLVHWVPMVSARTCNTLLCLQVYFCSELPQAASTCSTMPRVLLQALQVSSSMMPHF